MNGVGDGSTGLPWTVRLPGVYRPQEDTALLIEALRARPMTAATSVLDVCTGSGAVAVAAAAAGSRHVIAVDVCRRAVWTARCNALLHGHRCVDVRRADMTDPRAAGRFDLIVCNPPYVPTPPASRTRGAEQAWNAGARGRALLDPLCTRLPSMLTDEGRLLIVQSECADIDRTVALLARRCADARVVARRRIPFGPVMSARSGYLERAGLLPDPAARPGVETEEIVVVEAVKTARWPSHSAAVRYRAPARLTTALQPRAVRG
ncbi:HemK2/MTQ2 family protein methyltransferase [Tomitella gaofuii]|uniref:HemK2/MTQ2 family protein methyltransferase n=1 Tax=Tomitella gaofuii TaxID=2760083 RepID=UPI0015F8EA88|nr:HemK2/MTQ2 family protein methyltransferase [Tomitella gaofuii]